MRLHIQHGHVIDPANGVDRFADVCIAEGMIVSVGAVPEGFVADSTGVQASHRLLSLRSANGLLLMPQRPGYCEAGTVLECLLIGPLG